MNAENITYFNSFGVEHIPKEIRKLIRKKNITTNREYKDMIKKCTDIFVLDLLSPC